ncbi:MAG: hypothetical protein K2M64_03420 [Clostridia bacterium]|nr:hypothetical protein [Clostridia bacterium]
MNKAKLIAVSAICAAVCVGCLALAAFVKWVALIAAAIATVACAMPTLIDARNWWYSVLILIASGALGVFLGTFANVLYVAPIVAFCMPFGIVKAYGESVKVTASFDKPTVLEDPFDSNDDKRVVAVEVKSKSCLNKVVKWVLYYVLLEVALGLTVLCAYLFMPDVLQTLITSNTLYWLIGAAQLVVIPYDLLIRGCYIGAIKILRKAHII